MIEKRPGAEPADNEWLSLATAVEALHSLPHTDQFDRLMREHRLRETTALTPPESSCGICVSEDLLAMSNFAGLFGTELVTIRDFSLVVDTFGDTDTAVYGQFYANGTPYCIEQRGDMLLLVESNAPELPGFAIEPKDVQYLIAGQIAAICKEDPEMTITILQSLHEPSSEIETLHNTAFVFGNILGTSTRRISATFDNPANDTALIIQYSETETPNQSEYGNQLDIGYMSEAQSASELMTHEVSIPPDKDQRESSYHGVTTTTDMSPQDVVEYVRLHGRLDEFDMLLGAHFSYPPTEEKSAKAYGALCQQLLTVIEPKLQEIAER